MNHKTTRRLLGAALLAALALPTTTHADTPAAVRPATEGAPAAGATGDDLSPQDREALAWAKQLAAEATQIMEGWLSSGAISEEKLFARLYYPIPQRDPPKFSTDYDTLADRDFQAPQEKMLGRSSAMVYSLISDVNGYIPTHNQRYSAPLTGNRIFDLVNNRTKRIFGDRTGIMAGRNELPYLLQHYKRDTGEVLYDLSVPIILHGRHFGCVRIGYRHDDR